MKSDAPIALVTGASSGIGEATAERLARAGYRVYGTSRRAAASGRRSFAMVSLDVTSTDSVAAAISEVLRAATAVRPKLRYTAGGLASRLRWLRRLAPAAVMDAGIRKDLRLDAAVGSRS